jgi:cell division septation protein DedD
MPADPNSQGPAESGDPMIVILNGVPTPIMSVSPLEPAFAEKHRGMFPAAPASASASTWARAPRAALAFLGTIGVLTFGYWAGYITGTGVIERPAELTAKAAETENALPEAAPSAAVLEAESAAAPEPVSVTEPVEEAPAPTQSGLHLQVSASSDASAVAELRERLEKRGFPVRVDATSEDALVRVYVGPIADKDELRVMTSALRKEGFEPFPKRL